MRSMRDTQIRVLTPRYCKPIPSNNCRDGWGDRLGAKELNSRHIDTRPIDSNCKPAPSPLSGQRLAPGQDPLEFADIFLVWTNIAFRTEGLQ